jgi:hypothetical protein
MRWNRVGRLVGALTVILAGGAWTQEQGQPPAPANEPCAMCHSEPSFFRNKPDSASLVVTPASLEGSVHAAAGLSCRACHPTMATFPHPQDAKPAACATCHPTVGEQFNRSPHGYALERGSPRAPTCQSCHGFHRVLSSSNPASSTHKVRLPQTCARCHGAGSLLWDQLVKLPQSFTAYASSVHGQGAERGIAAAASCADCHGVHDLLGSVDPHSPINPRNVASTCGKCHPDIQLEYDASIHGRALQAGVGDSPTCTNCHGEHHILSPRDPEAKTYAARLATETCGTCHDDPVMIAKYNMEGGVVGSYRDSYHGWASRHDYERAATCVSCHSVHHVLPKSDSASTVHVSNVVATCRQCHENADEEFAASYTHATASLARNPINRWIKNIYVFLIVVLIGGMVLHNLIIMNFYMMKRRREIETAQWVLRFDRSQVLQHLDLRGAGDHGVRAPVPGRLVGGGTA